MRVLIVGAGVSGIAMAVELRRAGIEDFEILERADDVGGVWFHNTYPGAACDVPSYLYSYSWAQRKDWSQPCSPQEEILEYLRGVARDQGIAGRIRFGTEVVSADFDEAAARWRLRSASGEAFEGDALVVACGQLSRPRWPEIPGRETFAGHEFHSAEWDHDHDLAGRRVAVVGTGASAIQFVPPVAEAAGHTTVYQRTAPYMMPRRNPRYPRPVRELIRRVPGVQAARRLGMWLFMEYFVTGLTKVPPVRWGLEAWSRGFMRLQVRDPELLRRVTPDYAFGCKRILFSSNYLPALQRPDVELVTDRIERITERGVVTADGVERPADTIIWGTGFQADAFVLPMAVHGLGGRELQEAWSEGAEAHLGITVSGYPNLFLTYGPNTNLGVGSIIVMIEAQVAYIRQALELLRRTGAAAVDVRPEVQAASGERVQARLRGSVWTACHSWYRRDGEGRVTNNWPGYMIEYVHRTRRLRPEEFRLLRRAPRRTAEPVG